MNETTATQVIGAELTRNIVIPATNEKRSVDDEREIRGALMDQIQAIAESIGPSQRVCKVIKDRQPRPADTSPSPGADSDHSRHLVKGGDILILCEKANEQNGQQCWLAITKEGVAKLYARPDSPTDNAFRGEMAKETYGTDFRKRVKNNGGTATYNDPGPEMSDGIYAIKAAGVSQVTLFINARDRPNPFATFTQLPPKDDPRYAVERKALINNGYGVMEITDDPLILDQISKLVSQGSGIPLH